LRSRVSQRLRIDRIVKAKTLIERYGNGNLFAPCFSNLSRRQADSDAGLTKQTIQIDVTLDQTRKPADESFIKDILRRDGQAEMPFRNLHFVFTREPAKPLHFRQRL